MGKTLKVVSLTIGGGLAALTGLGLIIGPVESAPAPKVPVKVQIPAKKNVDKDVSFKLNAPDAIGIQYVDYKITNSSSKPSDYTVKYEVLNSKGVRVAASIIFEDSVNPGQTVAGKDLTSADKGTTLKVTDVTRTASFE